MFVNPSSAFVGCPSVVCSSSGSAKNARYARLLPSTRKSSASRAGPSSSSSSAPVSVFGDMDRVYSPSMTVTSARVSSGAMAAPDIVPFSDEHLDAAAELLAERHARHRAVEPLLPEALDFRAEIEREWLTEGASGVIALEGGAAAGYLIGQRREDAVGPFVWSHVA